MKSRKYLSKNPQTYDYTDIPPHVVKYSKRCQRPPTGLCICGQQGYLSASGNDYICETCRLSSTRPVSCEPVVFYDRAGSNYHRKTGAYVDCHCLDPSNYPVRLHDI